MENADLNDELMSNRLLAVGDVLVLAVPVRRAIFGRSLLTSRVYFFRIGFSTPFYYEYELPTIPANSGTAYGYFGADGFNDGDDILRIERDDFHCYHVFVVPDHPDLRVFKKLSTHDAAFSALDRKSSRELPIPATGTNIDHDFYDTKMICATGGSKFNPTSVAENLIVRTRGVDEGKSYQWAFFNPTNQDIGTLLYLIGRGYKLIPITDQKIMEKLLSLSLRRKEGTRANRILKLSVGDVYKGEWGFEGVLPRVWDEMGNFIELTEDVINRIDVDLLEREIVWRR